MDSDFPARLESQLAAMTAREEELVQMREEFKEAKGQVAALELAVQQARSVDTSELDTQLSELCSAIDLATEEMRATERQVANQARETAKVLQAKQSVKQECADLKAQISAATNEISNVHTRIEQIEQATAFKRQKIEALHIEIETRKNLAEKRLNQLRQKEDAEIAVIQTEISNIQVKSNQLAQETNRLTLELSKLG